MFGCKNSLCLLIEIHFVRRTAALCDKEEFVLVRLGGINVNLGGKIAARIDFFPDVERRILRIAVLCAQKTGQTCKG